MGKLTGLLFAGLVLIVLSSEMECRSLPKIGDIGFDKLSRVRRGGIRTPEPIPSSGVIRSGVRDKVENSISSLALCKVEGVVPGKAMLCPKGKYQVTWNENVDNKLNADIEIVPVTGKPPIDEME